MALKKESLKSRLNKNIWLFSFVVAGLLFLANVFLDRRADFSDFAARHMNKVVNTRFCQLESYMERALKENQGGWMELKGLPSDMVVYRYYGDSLQSWCNQFSLDNDDVSQRLVVQRFVNLRYNFVSPLAEVDDSVKYMNIGPKWYLVKSIQDRHGCKIIGGLEIRNTMDTRSINGINPKFRISDRFSIYPINYSGGAVIFVKGQPLMKLLQETARIMPILPDTTMLWLSVAFFIFGVLIYLWSHRNIKTMLISILALTAVMGTFYATGYGMQGSSSLFSPTVYAGGTLLFSRRGTHHKHLDCAGLQLHIHCKAGNQRVCQEGLEAQVHLADIHRHHSRCIDIDLALLHFPQPHP